MNQLLAAPAVQFLGGKGHGKTTHLCALIQEAESRGERVHYYHVPPDSRRAQLTETSVDRLALDEVQRLSWLSRRAVFRYVRSTNSRLNVTSHDDWSRWFKRNGIEVLTISLEDVSVRWILDYFNRRLEAARLEGASRSWPLTDEGAVTLAEAYGGDIYALEFALYRMFNWLSLQIHLPATVPVDGELLRQSGCLQPAPPAVESGLPARR